MLFFPTVRPALPGPVWALQLGNVVNAFGFGVVLPFEIIYLHEIRGFTTLTAGLVSPSRCARREPTLPS